MSILHDHENNKIDTIFCVKMSIFMILNKSIQLKKELYKYG